MSLKCFAQDNDLLCGMAEAGPTLTDEGASSSEACPIRRKAGSSWLTGKVLNKALHNRIQGKKELFV